MHSTEMDQSYLRGINKINKNINKNIIKISAQLLDIVVSACMAQGWQVEDETGLQVHLLFLLKKF